MADTGEDVHSADIVGVLATIRHRSPSAMRCHILAFVLSSGIGGIAVAADKPATQTAPGKAPPASTAAAPETAVKACVDACSTSQDRCATDEAASDQKGLCATNFKVCIERCDPHYLNYNRTVLSHPVKPEVAPQQMTPAEQCADGCGGQSRTCSDAGNDPKVCEAGHRACLARCALPGR